MSLHGLNSLCVDADAGTVITPEWAAHLKSCGVTRVRVTIDADSRNMLPIPLYVQSATIYRDAGIAVLAVLPLSFCRPWLEPTPRLYYPNAPLGYSGNARQNQHIREVCHRADQIARALVPLGVVDWQCGNEENLQGMLVPGQNCPPSHDDKAPATAPSVLLARTYEVAGYLHAAGARTVTLGSLSWIGTSGNDIANGFCAGYLLAGLSFLKTTGVKDLSWLSAIAVNAEGYFTPAIAAAMAGIIAHVTTLTYGTTLPLVVGEHGERNDALRYPESLDSLYALWSVASADYLYSHQLRTPRSRGDFGLIDMVVSGTGIHPYGDPLPWASVWAFCLAHGG